MTALSPVHKLLGNFSATLGFFGNFQLVEQLSMHRATSQFLCLLVAVMLLLRVKQLKCAEYKNTAYVENLFVQSISFTVRKHMFLWKSASKKQEAIIKQQIRNFWERNIQAKDRNFLLSKETFIWSKTFRVVNHSVNMGVVEI